MCQEDNVTCEFKDYMYMYMYMNTVNNTQITKSYKKVEIQLSQYKDGLDLRIRVQEIINYFTRDKVLMPVLACALCIVL